MFAERRNAFEGSEFVLVGALCFGVLAVVRSTVLLPRELPDAR